MSVLRLRLISSGQTARTLSLSAETVIETSLTVSPGLIERPTLVSTENIIGRINDAGFELASGDEVDEIAEQINTYYLPTPRVSWNDKSINVKVVPILQENVELYRIIEVIRITVLDTVQEPKSHEHQGQDEVVTQAGNRATPAIEESVKSRPGLKEKILELLRKTAIPRLVDGFLGLTIDVFLKFILGGVFHINPQYL